VARRMENQAPSSEGMVVSGLKHRGDRRNDAKTQIGCGILRTALKAVMARLLAAIA
jgi:hypothetical protein